MLTTLSVNAFASSFTDRVADNLVFLIGLIVAPMLAWAAGTFIFKAKIEASTPPGKAGSSSMLWMVGIWSVFIATDVLYKLSFTIPWWGWVIVVAIPLLFFWFAYRRGGR